MTASVPAAPVAAGWLAGSPERRGLVSRVVAGSLFLASGVAVVASVVGIGVAQAIVARGAVVADANDVAMLNALAPVAFLFGLVGALHVVAGFGIIFGSRQAAGLGIGLGVSTSSRASSRWSSPRLERPVRRHGHRDDAGRPRDRPGDRRPRRRLEHLRPAHHRRGAGGLTPGPTRLDPRPSTRHGSGVVRVSGLCPAWWAWPAMLDGRPPAARPSAASVGERIAGLGTRDGSPIAPMACGRSGGVPAVRANASGARRVGAAARRRPAPAPPPRRTERDRRARASALLDRIGSRPLADARHVGAERFGTGEGARPGRLRSRAPLRLLRRAAGR